MVSRQETRQISTPESQGMSNDLRYLKGYAVIRVDDGPVDHQSRVREYVFDGVTLPAAGPSNVQVKEIVMSAEEAQKEVLRLNKLNASKGCTYYWQSTHIFINGGSHGAASAGADDDS